MLYVLAYFLTHLVTYDYLNAVSYIIFCASWTNVSYAVNGIFQVVSPEAVNQVEANNILFHVEHVLYSAGRCDL